MNGCPSLSILKPNAAAIISRCCRGPSRFPHVHPGYEEFYVIEGEAVESDGTVIKAGDFISFPPGSYHSTRTDKGCLVLVFEWRP